MTDLQWIKTADAALVEVSDPVASILTKAQDLILLKRTGDALALLDRGIRQFPADVRLFPAHLQANLDKANRDHDVTALANAKKDAQALAQAGSAEGHYILGKFAEADGDTEKAQASYRAALAATEAADVNAYKYKAALARSLTALPAPMKTGMLIRPTPLNAGLRKLDVSEITLLSFITMLVAPPGDDARYQESQKLADEILNAKPGTVPLDVIAQALLVKGQHTKALVMYVESLRPTLHKEQYDTLREIIRSHPLLRQNESDVVNDTLKADRFYLTGREQYNDRNWAGAEKSFRAAVEAYDQDARYYYFLGLARLAQGEKDTASLFRKGAKLESENRPKSVIIDRDLETVQGVPRRILDEARRTSR